MTLNIRVPNIPAPPRPGEPGYRPPADGSPVSPFALAAARWTSAVAGGPLPPAAPIPPDVAAASQPLPRAYAPQSVGSPDTWRTKGDAARVARDTAPTTPPEPALSVSNRAGWAACLKNATSPVDASPSAAPTGLGHNAPPELPPMPGTVAEPSPVPPETELFILTDAGTIAAAERYFIVSAEFKRLKAEREKLNAKLKAAMAGRSAAVAGSRVLTLSHVAELPPTVITADMIGQEIGGKAGYDRLDVA